MNLLFEIIKNVFPARRGSIREITNEWYEKRIAELNQKPCRSQNEIAEINHYHSKVKTSKQ